MSQERNTEPNPPPNNLEEETPSVGEFVITFQIFYPTEEDIPTRRMNLRPRSHRRPPIPDLFEQSYIGGLAHFIIQVFIIITKQFLLRRLDASGNRTYPASETALEALQKFPHLSEKRRQKHKLCAICQEDFPEGPYPVTTSASEQTNETKDSENSEINYEEIVRMPCHHISTNDEEYNEGINTRMKDRNEKLNTEGDTDDESEEPESIPSSLKRKRSSSTVDVSQKKIKVSEEESNL
ncbi:hypothetical protein HDV01_002409 [Terramyces sp. JEL0728]|nr:hypothetical protein HDV01_002409 [Terramyces sp. JEL0728]